MADLINRDHAAQAIEAYLCSQCEYDTDRDPVCIACPHLDGGEILKSVPTIEPKCGEWMETEPDEDDRKIGIEFSIKCSRCHDENSHLDFNENHEITGKTFWKSRFCPNCGAYMRGGSEDAGTD